jgi:arsenate reductase (thioredoxin)
MPDRLLTILFLCTHNSARSIIAESIVNHAPQNKCRAYSAGSQPRGSVHPYALDLLRQSGHDTSGLRSKSWQEFAQQGAPALDFVFTVCDSAAEEVCPIWPGQPMTAHWGVPDPSLAEGNEAERRLAFARTMRMLSRRIEAFVNLPFASLDGLSLQNRVRDIGRMQQD